jgi:hypothetical protein
MGQMQDKIMTELRRIAEEDAALEFVDQPQYANTGSAYIQCGFDTLAEMQYGFFDTYCSITFRGTAVAAAGLPDNPPSWRASPAGITWHSLVYGEDTRLRAMLGVVKSVLAAVSNRELRAIASGTRDDHPGSSIWEYGSLDPQAVARFVVEVARLRMDGEGPGTNDEDEPWVMEDDDAFDTVHSLIDSARELLGWDAGKPPLDCSRRERRRMMRRYSARQRRDRAANMNAQFLPQRDDDESPAIDVAGALAVMYVKNGELYLGVDLDTADPAIYRMYGDQQVPLRITVQGDTVFEATGP